MALACSRTCICLLCTTTGWRQTFWRCREIAAPITPECCVVPRWPPDGAVFLPARRGGSAACRCSALATAACPAVGHGAGRYPGYDYSQRVRSARCSTITETLLQRCARDG